MVFTGEHAQFLQVLQILLVPIFSLLAVILGYVLKVLRELRTDIKTEAKRFEDFVRKDTCRMHREMIVQHQKEFENRIKEALSHCKKRNEEELG